MIPNSLVFYEKTIDKQGKTTIESKFLGAEEALNQDVLELPLGFVRKHRSWTPLGTTNNFHVHLIDLEI